MGGPELTARGLSAGSAPDEHAPRDGQTAGPAAERASLAGVERSLFTAPALAVAPRVLNLVLVRDGLAGRIVEVEAYEGAEDPASHAFRGPTRRNRTMFGPPGHLYVYVSYGIHCCANLVCGEEGVASAVLVRALEPLGGIEAMRRGRPDRLVDGQLCAGPGRLCTSLGIRQADDGTDLLLPRVAGASGGDPASTSIALLDDGTPPPAVPWRGPRVGLSERCGEALGWRWRFAVPGNRAVSRPRPADWRIPPEST